MYSITGKPMYVYTSDELEQIREGLKRATNGGNSDIVPEHNRVNELFRRFIMFMGDGNVAGEKAMRDIELVICRPGIIDANRNGRVTIDEIMAYLEQKQD